ncbi:MAG: hypothetical protein LH614_12100, partial [Pyrinomonadaceae bacterium]|nr:hypothetical protein [Pyrinomonadaceae bacterium]
APLFFFKDKGLIRGCQSAVGSQRTNSCRLPLPTATADCHCRLPTALLHPSSLLKFTSSANFKTSSVSQAAKIIFKTSAESLHQKH